MPLVKLDHAIINGDIMRITINPASGIYEHSTTFEHETVRLMRMPHNPILPGIFDRRDEWSVIPITNRKPVPDLVKFRIIDFLNELVGFFGEPLFPARIERRIELVSVEDRPGINLQ